MLEDLVSLQVTFLWVMACLLEANLHFTADLFFHTYLLFMSRIYNLLIWPRQFLLLIYWIDINSCLFFCLFLNGSFFLLCRATRKTRCYFEFCTITSLEHYLTNNGWRVQHNFSIYHPASWICLCWMAEGKPLCPQTNLDKVLF